MCTAARIQVSENVNSSACSNNGSPSNTHRLEDLRAHERLDHRYDAIEKRHHIDDMYLTQLPGQAFLQVLEELFDAGNPDACQVAKSHLFHIEHEYQTGVRSELVQTRVDGHEERLDGFVEMIVGRLRVG